jgi:hypothetical protein
MSQSAVPSSPETLRRETGQHVVRLDAGEERELAHSGEHVVRFGDEGRGPGPDPPAASALDLTAMYGITPGLREPVDRACGELLRAVNALSVHHASEAHAASNAGVEPMACADSVRLSHIAAELRRDREDLLGQLRALEAPLADLVAEARSWHADNALQAKHVEPDPLITLPRPLVGVDLTEAEEHDVLRETVKWTQSVSRWLAVEALGPCYTLGVAIEHSTPEAARLRRNLQEAQDHLKRFVQRQ